MLFLTDILSNRGLRVSSFALSAVLLSACMPDNSTTSSSGTPGVSSSSKATTSSSSSGSSNPNGMMRMIKAINVGGDATTYEGVAFEADIGIFTTGGSPNTTTDPISGTSEGKMFQSERYGTYGVKIPVTNATYSVELFFVEMYNTAPGDRSFDVAIEGQTKMSAVDIFAEVGHDTTFSYTIDNIQVSDKELNIDLTTITDNATLSGLAIYSANGEFVPPPEPEPPKPGERSSENPTADCTVPNVPTSISNSKLPDPFTKIDGTRISTKQEWRCRRQEILRMAEENTHGVKPPPPQSVSGSMSGNTLTINVQDQGKSTSFKVSVSMPSGAGPFPAVVTYSGSPTSSTFQSENVAVINMDPFSLGSERSRNPKSGAFYDIYGSNSKTGLLIAWGWGVSRIIDYYEQEWEKGNGKIIPERFAVTGCSRFGKGAFAAGVFDARVALTVPVESGSGGTPAWRSIAQENGAQPLSSAYGEAPWFGDAFSKFTSNPSAIPIDSHELIGMVAPRGLLVLEQKSADWLGITSSHLANMAGAEIYKALGAGDALTYIATSGSSHCSFSSPWEAPLRANIKRFLKGENAQTGGITPASGKTANLSNWRDWTTPTLSGDLNWNAQ